MNSSAGKEAFMRRFSYLTVLLLFAAAVPSAFGQSPEGQSASSETTRRDGESLDQTKTSAPICVLQRDSAGAKSSKAGAPIVPTLPTEEMRTLFHEAGDRNQSGALRSNVLSAYGRLPLSFEANMGQTDESVKFLSRGLGYALYLTGSEAVLSLQQARQSEVDKVLSDATSDVAAKIKNFDVPQSSERDARPVVLRMQLVNANPEARISGVDELPGKSNYFIGNKPGKWHADVPMYAKIKYDSVYPGVNLVYYGNRTGRLEYDFVVAPGADPRKIRLAVTGNSEATANSKESEHFIRIDTNGGHSWRGSALSETCGLPSYATDHLKERRGRAKTFDRLSLCFESKERSWLRAGLLRFHAAFDH
jgi:hypothetical protein